MLAIMVTEAIMEEAEEITGEMEATLAGTVVVILAGTAVVTLAETERCHLVRVF
jgi:hypothetical protein